MSAKVADQHQVVVNPRMRANLRICLALALLFFPNLVVDAAKADTYQGLLSFKFITPSGVYSWNKCPDGYTADITIPVGVDRSALVATFELAPGATASQNGVPQISGVTANNVPESILYQAGDQANSAFYKIFINRSTGCPNQVAPNAPATTTTPTTPAPVPATTTPNEIAIASAKKKAAIGGDPDVTCWPSQYAKGKTWIFEYRKILRSTSSTGKKIESWGPSQLNEITKWNFYHRPESGGAWKKIVLSGKSKYIKLSGPGNGVEFGVVGYVGTEKVCNIGYPGTLGSFTSYGTGKFNEAAYKADNAKSEADALADRAWMEERSKITCDPNGKCPLGSTGPGGGIIFYDAGSKKSWGRYLEAAPLNQEWANAISENPDPWCIAVEVINGKKSMGTEKIMSLKGKFEKGIGYGAANTKLLVKNCVGGGAGATANAYDGGGKSDWFLPSKDELNELMKFAFNEKKLGVKQYANYGNNYYLKKYLRGDLKIGTWNEITYWSSTIFDVAIDSKNGNCPQCAWAAGTTEGLPTPGYLSQNWSVRPIRYV